MKKNNVTIKYKSTKIKTSAARKTFVVINTLLLILLSFLFVAPYLNVLAQAFNDAQDTAQGGLGLWPREWTLANFKVVFADDALISAFILTVVRVIIGSLWALFVTYSAAYALTKKKLWGRGFIVALFTIPMFIGGGLIANLIIYSKLKIYDTFFVYILPGAFSFFNMVVIRTFLNGIPNSLREAAYLDGAGEFTIMTKVYLPLSMPIVATILLWVAVGYWNDWTTTLYYVQSSSLYTLQYNLQLILKQSSQYQTLLQQAIANGMLVGEVDTSVSGASVQAANIIVATVPILVAYPFLQKYFIKGVMIGGVKE